MFKSAVQILVPALLFACGGTDMRGEADAAGDMEELGDVPGDVVPDGGDVMPDSTCGGTPFIRAVRKGSEYTTGCNPDGSTTEELAATDIGGCCISLEHYCTWLNCCARFMATVRPVTTPWNLTVNESEIGPFCWCEGWYSPSYEICGLTPGTWTIWIGSLSITVVVS